MAIDETDVRDGGRVLVGAVALVIALLMLVVGDGGAWSQRLALAAMAGIPGLILLDRVWRSRRA